MNIAININDLLTPTTAPFVNPTNFPASRFSDISSILSLITPLLISGASVLLVAMLAYAGFSYMRSGGKSEEINKIKQIIIYSTVGFLIVISGYFIIQLVLSIFDIQSTPF